MRRKPYVRQFLSPFDALTRGEPDVPPRSRLAPMEPLGMGTGFRECLSSYLQRLADAYCTTPHILIRESIWPGVRHPMSVEADICWQSSSFNTIGRIPGLWARLLSASTGIKGLERLTLMPLCGELPFRNLASNGSRWCPLCLNEDLDGSTPYGRLLWNMEAVTACPKHEIRLIGQCGCSSADAVAAQRRKYLPHLCRRCGRSLGHSDLTRLEPATPGEVHRSLLIFELLGSDLFEEGSQKPGLTGVSIFLQKEVQRVGSAATLARMIGVSKGSFHGWVSGRHHPPLPWIVRIAERSLVPIREVLSGGVQGESAKESPNLLNSLCMRRKRAWYGTPIKKEATRLKLLEALGTTPPTRLSEVCKRLDTDRRILRMMHPDLVKSLTSRWGEWSREETKRRHQERASVIRFAAEEFALRGVVPTVNRVSARLQGKVTIFSSARAECAQICEMVAEEFGLSSPQSGSGS